MEAVHKARAAKAERAAKKPETAPLRPPFPAVMLGAAVLTLGLAVYQWVELAEAKKGNSLFCSINKTFDCATVWDSAFAKSIHRLSGVPIAGWGVVWSGVAVALAALVVLRARDEKPYSNALSAARVTALAGALSAVGLFAVSLSLGVWCVTCLGTYVLVAAFAAGAWKAAPRPTLAELNQGLGLAATLAIGGLLVARLLGSPPAPDPVALDVPKPVTRAPSEAAPSGDLLFDFIAQSPSQTKEMMRNAFADYQMQPVVDARDWPARNRVGPENAPVRIVEFFDIRCPHCKSLAETLHEIERTVPSESFSIELRTFPLDGGCNPTVTKEMVDPTGVRCGAAQALACLEGRPAYRKAQDGMFAEQERLTLERVLAIAADAGGMSRAELEKCMSSKETAAKLTDDIAYARAFSIDGTPLVVVNGRQAPPVGPFLYGLIVSNGDLRAVGWQALAAR